MIVNYLLLSVIIYSPITISIVCCCYALSNLRKSDAVAFIYLELR